MEKKEVVFQRVEEALKFPTLIPSWGPRFKIPNQRQRRLHARRVHA